MLRLRPCKLSDLEYILKWFDDELTFKLWCANRFTYPVTEEQLEEYYNKFEHMDNAWTMTALNEEGIPVGHFLMRHADYERESIHLGYVIIDPSIRGQGYGKEMISLAVKYSFDILKIKKVILGVFENNLQARCCYKAAGFEDAGYSEDVFEDGDESWGVYRMIIEK